MSSVDDLTLKSFEYVEDEYCNRKSGFDVGSCMTLYVHTVLRRAVGSHRGTKS